MGRGNLSFNLIVFLKLSTVYLPNFGFGQRNHIISQVLSIHLHLYQMKIVKNAPKMLKFFKLFLRGRMPSDLRSGMGLSAPYLLEDDHRQTPDDIATLSSFLLLLSSPFPLSSLLLLPPLCTLLTPVFLANSTLCLVISLPSTPFIY